MGEEKLPLGHPFDGTGDSCTRILGDCSDRDPICRQPRAAHEPTKEELSEGHGWCDHCGEVDENLIPVKRSEPTEPADDGLRERLAGATFGWRSTQELEELILAFVRSEITRARTEMLGWVVASLKEYPNGGGDTEVMQEVSRLLTRAADEAYRNAEKEVGKLGPIDYAADDQAGGWNAAVATAAEAIRALQKRSER